jgi:hypothetical protein
MENDSVNYMYAEANRLSWNPKEKGSEESFERDAVIGALDNLNAPLAGVNFEDLYNGVVFHMQNALGLLSQYEDFLARIEQKEKRRRSKLDAELSTTKNPETGKVYTRDAIKALIEMDEGEPDPTTGETDGGVVACGNYRLTCQAIIKFLRSLESLYRLHHERIVNINVNARRAAEY